MLQRLTTVEICLKQTIIVGIVLESETASAHRLLAHKTTNDSFYSGSWDNIGAMHSDVSERSFCASAEVSQMYCSPCSVLCTIDLRIMIKGGLCLLNCGTVGRLQSVQNAAARLACTGTCTATRSRHSGTERERERERERSTLWSIIKRASKLLSITLANRNRFQ